MALLEKFPFFIFGILVAISVQTIENVASKINFRVKFNFRGRWVFFTERNYMEMKKFASAKVRGLMKK